jgi:predicted metal-dependent peptidase
MTLEKCCKKLLVEHPFYGMFLLGLSKVLDTSVETACVQKRGINCELVINPNYWNSLSDDLQMSLLLHELYHIIFQHMFLWDLFYDKELLNIAADAEVNSYIDKLDPNWIHPSQFNLQPKQGTKFYYENIKLEGQAGKTVDDHSNWKDDFQSCSDAEKQLIQNQINSQIKSVAEQTQRMRGTIPGELSVIIEELFKVKPRIFNWKAYFRRMLGYIYDINIKKTRKKESNRFPESQGIKHKKKVSILVAVDTSGSVKNEELSQFFSEITHIYKAGARVTILECDTQISANYEFNGTFTGKIHGRGGTDFQPPVDYYREHLKEYSALIYFTDGECSLPENTPRDVIWVITPGGCKQDYPGKVLYIP